MWNISEESIATRTSIRWHSALRISTFRTCGVGQGEIRLLGRATRARPGAASDRAGPGRRRSFLASQRLAVLPLGPRHAIADLLAARHQDYWAHSSAQPEEAVVSQFGPPGGVCGAARGGARIGAGGRNGSYQSRSFAAPPRFFTPRSSERDLLAPRTWTARPTRALGDHAPQRSGRQVVRLPPSSSTGLLGSWPRPSRIRPRRAGAHRGGRSKSRSSGRRPPEAVEIGS